MAASTSRTRGDDSLSPTRQSNPLPDHPRTRGYRPAVVQSDSRDRSHARPARGHAPLTR